MKISNVLIIIFILTTCTNEKAADYSWMDKYKAIICLTYDDGMTTQYKTAIPQLNEFEMKGTFFINNVSTRESVVAWRNASKAGHELANHTLFHPCPIQLGWAKEVTTDYYSVDLILDEIKTVNSILDLTELESKKRAFAYPCNNTFVGNKSYKKDLEKSKLITYARTGSSDQPIINRDDTTIDLMSVPSWGVAEGTNFLELKTYVDKAVEANGIAVFQFHGVGGEWLSISSEDHRKLIEYLDNNKDAILVTTFSNAMKYLENI